LLLDAGNLFISKSKSSCDSKELGKADLILKSYQTMNYDAINVSQTDINLGVPFLLKKAKEMNLPLLSANLLENSKHIFNPFIIKKIDGQRVGIFGLMDQPSLAKKSNAYMVRDPFDATRDVLISLKDQAGLIIALSSLSKEKNVKLLEDFSDIDFIISTDKHVHNPIEKQNGYILSAGNKGRYLGTLDIRLKSQDRPLGLKNMGRKRKLRSNLSWTESRIIKLKEKKENILNSDNSSIQEKFGKELERLITRENQYRKELAKLDEVLNYFDNKIIPLASKQSEKSPKKLSSHHLKGKTKAKEVSSLMSPGSHIKITKLLADNGQKITFVLFVDKAPNQVRAFGLDVDYNSKVLKYSNYKKGELVEKFDMFDASKLREGRLRVGGFEARNDLIMQGKSGELIRLNFQRNGKGDMSMQIIGLKDYISAWRVEKIY